MKTPITNDELPDKNKVNWNGKNRELCLNWPI
jgi:hypothetical protein